MKKQLCMLQNQLLKDDFEGLINSDIWLLKRILPSSWKISKEYVREGISSLKITLHKGDLTGIGNDGHNTERAEFSENYKYCIKHGTNIWYSFSVYFPRDFLIINNRLVFAQWKQVTEHPKSPFISLRYINNELLFKIYGNNKSIKKFRKKVDLRGKWHDILINYCLNKDKNGYAKVWIDKDLFADYKGEMGYDFQKDIIYFKFGLYRDELDIPQTIYLDKFRRGTNQEEVTCD